MALTIPQAAFVGLLLELILYGGYLVLFVAHVKILWRRRSKDWTHYYQMATAVALLIALTLHTCVEMVHCYEAFTGARPAIELLTDTTLPYNRLKLAFWVTSVLIGDLFLVYRVYVVWGFDFRPALLPLSLWFALLGLAAWCVHTMAHPTMPGNTFEQMGCPVAKYPMMFTLIVNAVCTLLIAGKLWHMQRLTSDVYGSSAAQVNGKNPMVRAFVIVVESASAQMAALAAMVALGTVGSPYFFIMLAITAPLMGLLYAIIIVRSSASREQHTHTTTTTSTGTHRPSNSMQFRPRRLTFESQDSTALGCSEEGMQFGKKRESDLSFA